MQGILAWMLIGLIQALQHTTDLIRGVGADDAATNVLIEGDNIDNAVIAKYWKRRQWQMALVLGAMDIAVVEKDSISLK